jgi:hypothetical protein
MRIDVADGRKRQGRINDSAHAEGDAKKAGVRAGKASCRNGLAESYILSYIFP